MISSKLIFKAVDAVRFCFCVVLALFSPFLSINSTLNISISLSAEY